MIYLAPWFHNLALWAGLSQGGLRIWAGLHRVSVVSCRSAGWRFPEVNWLLAGAMRSREGGSWTTGLSSPSRLARACAQVSLGSKSREMESTFQALVSGLCCPLMTASFRAIRFKRQRKTLLAGEAIRWAWILNFRWVWRWNREEFGAPLWSATYIHLRENTKAGESMKSLSFVQHFFPATTLLYIGNFSSCCMGA